jgi:uroporphyrinogen-III synthase
VQLYPDNPHTALMAFLRGAAASVDPIVPYAYASEADEARVVAVIGEMAAGRVDLVAFTSSPQLTRLRRIARTNNCEDTLATGFARTKLAAVGPVVAAAIEAAGGTVAIAPDNFHLRPMVNAIVDALG